MARASTSTVNPLLLSRTTKFARRARGGGSSLCPGVPLRDGQVSFTLDKAPPPGLPGYLRLRPAPAFGFVDVFVVLFGVLIAVRVGVGFLPARPLVASRAIVSSYS